jgi:hypothetical protein
MPKSALFDIAQQHSLVISIGVARVSVSTHVWARAQSSWYTVAMVTAAAWPAELSRLRFAFLFYNTRKLQIRFETRLVPEEESYDGKLPADSGDYDPPPPEPAAGKGRP